MFYREPKPTREMTGGTGLCDHSRVRVNGVSDRANGECTRLAEGKEGSGRG